MPQRIAVCSGSPLELAEVCARLDEGGVDLTDADNLAQCAALLAGLARNRDFLADRLVAALQESYAASLAVSRYSAQVLLLHRGARGFCLRANIWPAASDAAYAASGAAAFSYRIPHDHNFHFLTTGYFGPGYISDHYVYDGETIDGRLNEPLHLRFIGRSQLAPGTMMLYRAHRDIHCQSPPDSLSVSLNILDERDQVPWRDQYIVDLDRRTIARRPTLTSGELLLRCAVHFSDNARDLADHFAAVHPVPRVRAHALAALAAVTKGAERAGVLERGLRDPDARVRDDCVRWLAG